MRCIFGDNDTPREQGVWSLEVPEGVIVVIMQTGPELQRSHMWDTQPLLESSRGFLYQNSLKREHSGFFVVRDNQQANLVEHSDHVGP